MTSIINSTVPEFKVQAYHNDKFVTVTNELFVKKISESVIFTEPIS